METTASPINQLFRLGVQHLEAGRWAEAETVYRSMLAQWPANPDIYHNLGAALKNQRKTTEAIALFNRALELRPDYAEVWVNLGDALCDLNKPTEAMQAYQRALKLRPNLPEAWNNIGIMLRQANQPDDAIRAYRQALSLRENFLYAWNNLAGALKDVGELDQAIAAYDRALALRPRHAVIHAGLVCMLHFHPGYDAMALHRATRQWNELYARPLAGEIPNHDNDPTPDRPLRIGYLSPDFRRHCLSLFSLGLLKRHDRRAIEVYCYNSASDPDVVTTRFKDQAHVWRDISALSDQAAAQLIRQDRIDILVEITLHMKGNRLLILARKPAPIQVSWLGYPGTTGLDAIDYRLTDPRLDPLPEIRNPKSDPGAPGRINDQNPNDPNSNEPESQSDPKDPGSLPHSDIGKLTSASSVEPGVDSDFGFRISDFATKESHYSERSIRLPDTFWCYDPRSTDEVPDSDPLEPGPLPALTAGHVTFGCLNNFCKVTDPTLQLWRQVLAALPDSHMVILSPPGPHRERVTHKLGVTEPTRVRFVPIQPRRQYLQTYRQIDLCLDTIPYNGHTTSLDSFWMGVPVITRVGHTVVGRAGVSQLYNLNLMELVARTDQEFVRIAVDLANDKQRLGHLRSTLRSRMEQSPLMDAPRFARNMEAAYRQIWRAWCGDRQRKPAQ